MPDYFELRLRIERGDAGAFRVFMSGPGGEASGGMVLPFEGLELENFVLRLSRARSGVRRVGSPETKLARDFGGRLFDALFQGQFRSVYLASRAEATAGRRGLRLSLDLTQVPELLNIPWEYLYDDPYFLSQSVWTPVVRYLDLPRGRRPVVVKLPLRILGMVSGPSDLPRLETDREKANLQSAVSSLVERGLVEIEWVEQATLACLLKTLERAESEGRSFHVFHYCGHGGYDPGRGDGFLVLEDELGRSDQVDGQRLATILHDTSMSLAVLNACEGGRSSAEDPFAGVASSLVEQEVPAVIAMQFEITDEAAVIFAESFYGALASNLPIDAAVAQARKAIFAAKNDVEWGTPVLFMRVSDGRIFDIQKPPVASGESPAPVRAPPPAMADVTTPVPVVPEVPHAGQVRVPGARQGRRLPTAVLVAVPLVVLLIAIGVFLATRGGPPPAVQQSRSVLFYNGASGAAESGRLSDQGYTTRQPSHPLFARGELPVPGSGLVVRTGPDVLFYDPAGGGVHLGTFDDAGSVAISSLGSAGPGWTAVASAGGQLLFYRKGDGATAVGVVSNGRLSLAITGPQSPGWTHVVGAGATLVFYNAERPTSTYTATIAATGALQFRPPEENETTGLSIASSADRVLFYNVGNGELHTWTVTPTGLRSPTTDTYPGYTDLVVTGVDVLFYNRTTGAAAAGPIGDDGHVHATHLGTPLEPGWTNIVAVPE